MSDKRSGIGSKPPSRRKSESASSKKKSQYFEQPPSSPLSEEPKRIDHSLYEQLEAKNRAIDELESVNRGLRADLLKHLVDPYAKYACSDGEIERHYRQLLHKVEQTARRLCEATGHDAEALIDTIRHTRNQEGGGKDLDQLACATDLLRRGYRGKFLQRSVAEMILFRALLRFALPPRIISTGLRQEENKGGEAFLRAMNQRTTCSNGARDPGTSNLPLEMGYFVNFTKNVYRS